MSFDHVDRQRSSRQKSSVRARVVSFDVRTVSGWSLTVRWCLNSMIIRRDCLLVFLPPLTRLFCLMVDFPDDPGFPKEAESDRYGTAKRVHVLFMF